MVEMIQATRLHPLQAGSVSVALADNATRVSLRARSDAIPALSKALGLNCRSSRNQLSRTAAAPPCGSVPTNGSLSTAQIAALLLTWQKDKCCTPQSIFHIAMSVLSFPAKARTELSMADARKTCRSKPFQWEPRPGLFSARSRLSCCVPARTAFVSNAGGRSRPTPTVFCRNQRATPLYKTGSGIRSGPVDLVQMV